MTFKIILKAQYDYEAAAEDELNFNENDVLGVLGDEGEGDEEWYFGCNVNDPSITGFIPKTYCEELSPLQKVKSNYEYFAQEENELSFGEGQELEVLYEIDADWWIARDQSTLECGMIPSNYVRADDGDNEYYEPEVYDEKEPEEQEQFTEQTEYYQDSHANEEFEDQDSHANEEFKDQYDTPSNDEFEDQEAQAPPPLPVKKNPVDELVSSQDLKMKSDALFLDSKHSKTKGQLILESALYLCSDDSIEHCYDLSELKYYDATDLKLALNSGEFVAIGLGKKDAKRFAELVKGISGYDAVEDKKEKEQETRAPTVVGPSMPVASMPASSSRTPMIVGVSFEGVEGEEISIFEGEEIYILEDSEDSQFSRIEKVNGVTGLVPRGFLMTRSEYQKKKNEQEESHMKQQQEEVDNYRDNVTTSHSANHSSITKGMSEMSFTDDKPMTAVQRKPSSASVNNSPWSALAKTGSVPIVQTTSTSSSTDKSAVKLENSRLWKDKSGKFQVEAEFVSLIDGKVTILKGSGSEVSVPLDVLSERDQEYACKRAGIPIPKTSKKSSSSSIVKGFDWLSFFLSLNIATDKAQEFAQKFSSQSFEESMICAFSSDFLTAQGMQMTDIYKILPEVARRKAQQMQSSAKEKHRNNTTQMVLSKGDKEAPAQAQASLVSYKKQQPSPTPSHSAIVPHNHHQEEIQKFPTIEELEELGAIEMTKGNSQVTLPNGLSISKTENGASNSNNRVLIQPVEINDNVREREREIITADGTSAKEYTRISTSSSISPMDMNGGSTGAIALMQHQMQANAMMQAQAQAQAQAQMQMRMQAQAQMQMQMRAQAQAQAQAQYAQQQRMYQMQQQQAQQAQAPSVHITIHTGDKLNNANPMTPPMPQMNQPMLQMNNNPMAMNSMSSMMNPMAMQNPMATMQNPMMQNPMAMQNPFNPFDPMNQQLYQNNPNNGFGF